MGAVMKSARAVMQFEPAPDVLLQTGKGFKVEKSLGWIKFSAEFRKNMLAQLKGAPLSVFMCICLHLNENGESFPGIDLIAKETGYKRLAVIRAIKKLENMGGLLKIVRQRGKSNHYHPVFASRGKDNDPVVPVSLKTPVIKKIRVSKRIPVIKKSSALFNHSKERYSFKENLPTKSQRVVVVKARKKKTTATTTSPLMERRKNPNYDKNLLMCATLGITEPMASRVSDAMPLTGVEVTPEFIQQHIATLMDGEVKGLAITRILAGEAPREYRLPVVTKSYVESDFAAFINPDQEDDPETCVYWEAGFTQRCGLPVTNGKHRYCDAHQLIVDIPKDRILSYSH
jgi:hypothetical protein